MVTPLTSNADKMMAGGIINSREGICRIAGHVSGVSTSLVGCIGGNKSGREVMHRQEMVTRGTWQSRGSVKCSGHVRNG